MKRPSPSEYAPYYGKYIELVPDGPIVDVLRSQMAQTLKLLRSIPEAKGSHAYAPGKWTIKDVVGHVTDGERVFSYRALRFARGDETALPGFDENLYAPQGQFGSRTLQNLTDELEIVRRSTVALFEGLPKDAAARKGTASNNPVSVQALAYIIAGHERHHVRILRERYLA
ncbi:MAG: DinB family protein [Candidatus Eiseniibacteriota bacterium]